MRSREFDIVVAYQSCDRGIGFENTIPWKIPEDLAFFRRLTTTTEDPSKKNAVIMGRMTFLSLPSQAPLPGRLNIILSSTWAQDPLLPKGYVVLSSLSEALDFLADLPQIERVFVIGGSKVYQEALQSAYCNRLYVTEILNTCFKCDRFFPLVSASLLDRSEIKSHSNVQYQFLNKKLYS